MNNITKMIIEYLDNYSSGKDIFKNLSDSEKNGLIEFKKSAKTFLKKLYPHIKFSIINRRISGYGPNINISIISGASGLPKSFYKLSKIALRPKNDQKALIDVLLSPPHMAIYPSGWSYTIRDWKLIFDFLKKNKELVKKIDL